METTENDFLEAAEKQFADHGYAGAKIRAIADQAKANLGALHYYWGSKEGLFRAACKRRMEPLIQERLTRFAAMDPANLKIEDILRAYFEPAFLQGRENPSRRDHLCEIYARILTDPSPEVKIIMSEIFAESTSTFVRLLRTACPHLDDKTFYWRLHAVLGIFQHSSTYTSNINRLAGGIFDAGSIETGLGHIIGFVASGLKAPAD